ncbi:MAG: translocation/assembly module TamB [Acidobacteria bacterium]|nr:MAG: translocation/assembly module TamB [Acidobacteriota bacterium]
MTEERPDTPEPRSNTADPAADTVEVAEPLDAAVETTAENDTVETPSVAAQPRLRRWTNGPARRYLRWGVGIAAVVVAVAIVATVTIDLGPTIRARAAAAASSQLEREVTIGRIGAYLAPGRFLVEDLVIGGLKPDDRPFLTAGRISVSIAWLALLHGELLVDAEMTDWQMLAELFPDGSQSFPAFVTRRTEAEAPVEPGAPTTDVSEEDEGRRFVYTLRYLRAHKGEFVLDDHGANFAVICSNLDLTITKILDYRGHASCSGGTIRIGDYEPIWMDMATDFELNGAQVHLIRVNLETDGASTVLVGDVDTADLPEMTFELKSDIDVSRLREIFFADENFTVSGDSLFTGSFHKFADGYDLRGSITSPVFGIDVADRQLRFPKLDAQLVWQPDRFDMWDITSTFSGGRVRAELSTLGTKDPWQGMFDVHYEDVDAAQLAELFELHGIALVSRAAGHHRLEWPVEESGGFRHTGQIQLEPPEGIRLATAEPAPGVRAAVAARAGRPPDLTSREFLLGGAVDYTLEDGWLELTSGRIATPSTHVTFEGRIRSGAETRIPFQVTSRNWQESDRLLAAVMTAVGTPTDAFPVDGYGTLDGVMLGDVASPRVEATFAGEDVRAWNVEWGAGQGEFVVENSYLEVTHGLFRREDAELHVDGLFSLGGPRDDGGEEMNAVFRLAAFPAVQIRAAFGLAEGYPIDGPATGEVHLYGAYRRLFGFGRMTLDHPVGYGEPFDSVTAGLRFEGNGVRLDGIEMRKGEGTVTGAAFIEWDGTYSFNWDARNIGVETLALIPEPPEPLSGTLEFTASGVGRFDAPRYEVRGTIVDLFIGDEEVGQVTGRLDVRDGALTLDLEGASSTIAVSVSGSVALTPENDADLWVRVVNASLDPYVRMFVPELSPYTTAVISGSLHVVGELRNWTHLRAQATIEQVDLSLFGYDIHNDGPIVLALDRQVVGIDRWRLAGEGTALELSGSVDLETEEISLGVDGDANFGILQSFFQDLRGSGDAVIRAEVTGSVRQPVLTGQATVSDGRIRHISLPHGLEAINGRIIFEPGVIRFDDVPAMVGGGPVRIGGRVGLNGFTPGELAITVTGQGVQLRYPEGVRSIIDTDLELRGDASAPVLAGTVTVREAVLLDGLELGGGLFGGGGVDDTLVVSAPEEPGLPLEFDIQIVAPSSLQIRNNTTRIVGSAELTLQGTYDRPLLFGTAEIDRGETFFLGNRYRVNYGTIGFANPTRIEPFVNVELETDVRVPGQTYRVAVQATGTLDRLVLTLTSDPPLPEVDIVSLLCGDIRDPQGADLRAARAPELAQQQRLQACAAGQLTSALSSGVGRVVEESFGVDTFQITPSFGDPSSQQSAQLNPTARVLIGKRISDRAHLTLSRALSGANSDLIVVLEYDQSDRLSWILSQNEDRTYALDFRVRHAF